MHNSLELLRVKWDDENKDEIAQGFLQVHMIHPLLLVFYNETSIRLFHDLASKNVPFWDATGSVVRAVPG